MAGAANLSAFTVKSNTHAQKFSFKANFKVLLFLVFLIFAITAIQMVMNLSPVLILAGFILIPAWIIYKSWRFKRAQKALISRLAADNNWALSRTTPVDASKAGPTVNLSISDTAQLAGNLSGLPFWLCIDDPDTYLLIDTKKRLPRAIFVASSYSAGPMRLVTEAFLDAEGLATVKLEGDFDKFFRLYAEPDAAIDTLSIVAPDFMISLIDAGSVSSVMLADHYCFIKAYSHYQKDLKGLMVSGQALAKELSDFVN